MAIIGTPLIEVNPGEITDHARGGIFAEVLRGV
jgi:hypothetical protein